LALGAAYTPTALDHALDAAGTVGAAELRPIIGGRFLGQHTNCQANYQQQSLQ